MPKKPPPIGCASKADAVIWSVIIGICSVAWVGAFVLLIREIVRTL